jgi:septal ring factor EnvC (AmiA/AmiB activator)
MRRFSACVRVIAALSILSLTAAPACTKKPSQDELTRLEEARTAAENAERKLTELRKEREQLEKVLAEKQAELKKQEQERDELKAKMGKQQYGGGEWSDGAMH